MALKIIEQHITKNQAYVANVKKADSRYTNFQKNGPKGAVLHSVGGNQTTAKWYADYFASPNLEASVHAVIQGDGTCYKLAPWNYRMWHVGGSANNTHVGVEMVEREDGSIYYDSNWKLHVVDRDKALTYVKKVYNNAVELFAKLCIEFGWDPLEDGVILSHSECHKRGIGSGHADPEHLWDALNSGLTMDKFRKAVNEKVKAELQKEVAIDIGKGHDYSADSRRKAIQKGIIKGNGKNADGSIDYDWTDGVTREELVTILDRMGLL